MPEQEESEQDVGAGSLQVGLGEGLQGSDVGAASLLEGQLQILHIQSQVHLCLVRVYIVQDSPQVGLVNRPIIDPLDYSPDILGHPLGVRDYPKPSPALGISIQDRELDIDTGQVYLALDVELEHVQPVLGAGQQLDLVLDGPAA